MDVKGNISKTQADYLRRIEGVMNYVRKHLAEEINLDALAEIACFSKFHFHRIFVAFTGETPAAYINRLRLEQAANMLVGRPDFSIAEVAYRSGFSSLPIFSRVFKKYFGVTPRYAARMGNEFFQNSKISQIESKGNQNSGGGMQYVNGEQINYSPLTKDMTMDIEIKNMPAMKIAGITFFGGYGEQIGTAFSKLAVWAGKHHYFSPSTKFIGIAYDNPDVTPAAKCRYKACMTVPEDAAGDNQIEVETIPQLTCAVLHYSGPQEGISAAYQKIYKDYLPENGLVPADYPCYEIHLNDPGKDAEHRYIFDICLPVEKL
jgi:AraC family transcriptional regulator